MSSIIEITHLLKKYGDKCAIDDLSLEIEEGKVTGLLGPNGAGKSTLFKILVHLVKPDKGSIRLLGDVPSVKLNSKIAYLPDRAGWYMFQTVKDAIDYASVIFPNFEINKAKVFLDQMNLDPNMKVESLSRGQQACLYLTFCLFRDVPICILDEPFSGIDLISRERIIQGIIDSIIDRKQTIIISTHEIYEAETLLDNVVFLDNGQLKLSGNVEELRKNGESIQDIYRRLYR